MPDECPLCRKVGQREFGPDELIWEFPHSLAFLGLWQYYHGYCVLVARKHARELSDLPPEECAEFLKEMCALARCLEKAFQPRKLNYELLGNQVPHLHWHLFPRYEHDPDKLKSVWLALERAEHDEQEHRRLTSIPAGRGTRTQTIAQVQGKLVEFMGHPP